MSERVHGIVRNPGMSNDVCTIYENADGSGYRVMQTNYMRLDDRGPVYQTKTAAIHAAVAQGFSECFASWHAPTFTPWPLPHAPRPVHHVHEHDR